MTTLKNKLDALQVVVYFLAIAAGAWVGFWKASGVFTAWIKPALVLMLFATFLQVPLTTLSAAFKNRRFIGALCLANFLGVPLVLAVLVPFLPAEPLVRLGVVFVLLTPCIDYVISFTHLAKGNAPLLLAMTPILLALQLLLLPLYLYLFLGQKASSILELGPFLQTFLWFIVLPGLLAALVQWLQRYSKQMAKLAQGLDLLPIPATALVLFVVPAAVMPHIALTQQVVAYVIPVYLAFALIAPVMAKGVVVLMRLDTGAARAVLFSASYRNSLVILPLAFAVPNAVPVLPAVILLQTLVELCFLPVYMRLIPWLCPRQID